MNSTLHSCIGGRYIYPKRMKWMNRMNITLCSNHIVEILLISYEWFKLFHINIYFLRIEFLISNSTSNIRDLRGLSNIRIHSSDRVALWSSLVTVMIKDDLLIIIIFIIFISLIHPYLEFPYRRSRSWRNVRCTSLSVSLLLLLLLHLLVHVEEVANLIRHLLESIFVAGLLLVQLILIVSLLFLDFVILQFLLVQCDLTLYFGSISFHFLIPVHSIGLLFLFSINDLPRLVWLFVPYVVWTFIIGSFILNLFNRLLLLCCISSRPCCLLLLVIH